MLLILRRNPVVAALCFALVLSIVAGTACSLHFARRAWAAEQDSREAHRSLEEANDRLLESLARSLLGPLAVQVFKDRPPPLTEAERKELEELANPPGRPKLP
jgi:hypothetical protein